MTGQVNLQSNCLKEQKEKGVNVLSLSKRIYSELKDTENDKKRERVKNEIFQHKNQAEVYGYL